MIGLHAEVVVAAGLLSTPFTAWAPGVKPQTSILIEERLHVGH